MCGANAVDFNACMMVYIGGKKLIISYFFLFFIPTTLAFDSSRKASWWCVTSSSCAGPHTATCQTPRKPSSAYWLRFTTGRESVERDAPLSTACESTYIHLQYIYAVHVFLMANTHMSPFILRLRSITYFKYEAQIYY